MVKRGLMLGLVALLTMAVSARWTASAEPQASGGEETAIVSKATNPSIIPRFSILILKRVL
jgi:hypothetical protein